MDTDSLYLILAEQNLYYCICPELKEQWEALRSPDCTGFFGDARTNSIPRTCCAKHKKHDKREPAILKEVFRCTEMLCLCSKTSCCCDVGSNKFKFSSKGLNKRILEQSGDGPLEKYRRVLEEKVKITSNIAFRTQNHALATYEQTKKGLSYFYPKRIVAADGNHTILPHL